MMYKPKDSARLQPKISLPIRLDDQCLNVVYGMLTRTAGQMASERNVREKKGLREYININLPVSIQTRIMQKCLDKLVGAQTALNLLDMFEPGQMAKDCVDLLGPFRLGFGCYLKHGRLTWSQGSAKKFNLTLPQLEQLCNIIIWSEPAKLQEICISIARDSIKLSRIPNILAQARSLTKITILSGAENHTLRIIGMNCPCLVILDLSHSIQVSDQGLRNLFLKNRRRNRNPADDEESDIMNYETNPCAETISSIILVGTSVTFEGCDFACHLMNFGYLSASLPFIKIVRMNKQGLVFKGLPFERQKMANFASSPSGLSLSDQCKDTIFTSVHNTLLPDQLTHTVMDYFTSDYQQERYPSAAYAMVFLRDNVESFKISLHLKLESCHVTSLVLPWYTFTWRLDSLVELDTLGTHFPNLKFLKGRVKGRWHHANGPLLPNLQAAYVWSLNSSTAVAMLQNIPHLKFLEFNNTQTVGVHETNWDLTDETLEVSLNKNKSLAENLEVFTLRPADLTKEALKTLTSKCPKLERIGDLESWNISSQQISEFNAYLDSIRSQCILTVMSFPPPKEEKYHWAF